MYGDVGYSTRRGQCRGDTWAKTWRLREAEAEGYPSPKREQCGQEVWAREGEFSCNRVGPRDRVAPEEAAGGRQEPC